MARSRRTPHETAVAEAGESRSRPMRLMPCKDASLEEVIRVLRVIGVVVPSGVLAAEPEGVRRHFVANDGGG